MGIARRVNVHSEEQGVGLVLLFCQRGDAFAPALVLYSGDKGLRSYLVTSKRAYAGGRRQSIRLTIGQSLYMIICEYTNIIEAANNRRLHNYGYRARFKSVRG